MSYSWPTNTNDSIDTTTGANNYQRPMTLSQNQVGGQPGYAPPQRPIMNNSALRPGMIASGGQTNRLPSGYFPGHPVGPPAMTQHPSHFGHPGGGGGGGPPPAMFVSHGGGGWGWGGMRAPPGALVVQPGDPRLGGM